jgi:predicted O-linked N-acetylglucosamine transferase (SPINDLY family)
VKKIKKYKKKIAISRLLNKEEPLSHYNSGIVLFNNQQYDEAIIHFQKALELNPNLIHAYNYLGNAFQEKKQFDEAIPYYRKAIQINPTDPTAYINLGIAFQNTIQHESAIEYFKAALQINPNLYQAYDYMGLSLTVEGNMEKAQECYESSLSINPFSEMTLVNLGNLVAKQGNLKEAEKYYQRALQINPNDLKANEAFVMTMLYSSHYDQQAIYAEHLRIAKKFAEPLSVFILPHANERIVLRKLRIGYVSPDFKRHPVAYFIQPVLAEHNRHDFEVFCYSTVDLYDDITGQIKNLSDHWRDISTVSDEKAAEEIRRDRIDILIDLSGHSAHNRMLLFARKPAPVQVTWIGYPPTTGLSAIDYKIVDNYTDPPGITDRFYSEKLMRLPECFVCYLPDRESPDVGPLPALSAGHVTFGSFNNFQKVTPQVFEAWSKIMNSVPGSRFIIKSKIFADNKTREYATDMFVQRGIATNRIILQTADPSPKHLGSYNLVDIGLDTFPFNGLTTTCEAMWMGVPVITLAGTGYAARAGVSLLSNVGLPDLIAKTPDEYISIAVNLANDLKRLRSLREHLRDMMENSPVCDAKSFTANLETCYRQMWEKWCKAV